MGGFFAVASKEDCVFDLFFGTDYHSHLGTRRGGMAVYGESGFDRAIHNIENSPFRTKFDGEVVSMKGNMGIGSISDYEPQPLIIRSHHGTYAISTVGRINNIAELVNKLFDEGHSHFLELSGGAINPTELVATLINQRDNLLEGIEYARDVIEGSITIILMTHKGIYAARDKHGRTPVVIGRKEDAICAAFECFAYLNLGYKDYKELGPGEIVVFDSENINTLSKPTDNLKICTFLWVYYGYPSSSYEGVSVEHMRYNCGRNMAKADNCEADIVAGVPDSGTAHAIGYSNASGIPFSRPLIKYTPTWPRSFIPNLQSRRDLIAKMKMIPVNDLINNRRLLLIDDSIVRGTQLRETAQFLYDNGALEVHVRPACPPIFYGCRYLNFSRATSDMDLISRRIIRELEGDNVDEATLKDYINPNSDRYKDMIDLMTRRMKFTSLRFNILTDMLEAVNIPSQNLCTYCWDGDM